MCWYYGHGRLKRFRQKSRGRCDLAYSSKSYTSKELGYYNAKHSPGNVIPLTDPMFRVSRMYDWISSLDHQVNYNAGKSNDEISIATRDTRASMKK